jgi:sodium-independent sulfate anion transporter 11
MVNRLLHFMSSHGKTKSLDTISEDYIETEPTIVEWLKGIRPTGGQVVDYVASLFPFSRWIFSYNLQWLAGDLVAGKNTFMSTLNP